MEAIFSTKERIKILNSIIFKEEVLSVNHTARQLKLSKGLLSKYFEILTKERFIKRVKGKFFVSDSPQIKGTRILLNIRNMNVKFFKKYPFVVSVGLYGSCAKGENREGLDVDFMDKG